MSKHPYPYSKSGMFTDIEGESETDIEGESPHVVDVYNQAWSLVSEGQ